MATPQKVNTKLSHDPTTLLLGTDPKRTESRGSDGYLCSHVHSSITQNSQKEKATQKPVDGQTDTQNVVHTHNTISFRLKKKEILKHATSWMSLEDIILSEISQPQKDKFCDFTYTRRYLE